MTIFLDSSPLSLLSTPSAANASSQVFGIKQWAADCDAAGHIFIVPECVDYEVRRELLRANKAQSVAELDFLKSAFIYLPLTTEAMLKAAELWAQTRQAGRSTAHDENIDIDIILCAQVLTSGLELSDIVVATSNLRHLSLFVNASLWTSITP